LWGGEVFFWLFLGFGVVFSLFLGFGWFLFGTVLLEWGVVVLLFGGFKVCSLSLGS